MSERAELITRYNRKRKRKRISRAVVRPSSSLIAQYSRELFDIVDWVYDNWIANLKRTRVTLQLFDATAEELNEIRTIEQNLALYMKYMEASQIAIATKYSTKGIEFNRKRFISEVRKAIGVEIRDIMTEKGVKSELNEAIIRNTKYIKSIGNDLNYQLQQAVMDAVKKGIDTKEDTYNLSKELMRIKGMSRNRAILIATDQMGKLNGNLNRIRQTNLGIDTYMWLSSRDSRVRPLHKKYDKQIFSWYDPPADGHPGQAVRCRCDAIPQFDKVLKNAA